MKTINDLLKVITSPYYSRQYKFLEESSNENMVKIHIYREEDGYNSAPFELYTNIEQTTILPEHLRGRLKIIWRDVTTNKILARQSLFVNRNIREFHLRFPENVYDELPF